MSIHRHSWAVYHVNVTLSALRILKNSEYSSYQQAHVLCLLLQKSNTSLGYLYNHYSLRGETKYPCCACLPSSLLVCWRCLRSWWVKAWEVRWLGLGQEISGSEPIRGIVGVGLHFNSPTGLHYSQFEPSFPLGGTTFQKRSVGCFLLCSGNTSQFPVHWMLAYILYCQSNDFKL